MNQVRKTLTIIFWTFIALSLLTVILFETGIWDFGYYAGSSEQAEFLLTIMMELLTLAVIPLALKLFKLKNIHADLLKRKEEALGKWGILRLLMLEVPMLLNTLLYYAYANTTFGYMAIILCLTLFFVYPSKERCLSEVSEE